MTQEPSSRPVSESDQKKLLLGMLETLKASKESRINLYQPNLKQKEFHALGAKFSERVILAGNQLGKTFCGGAETTFHMTGLYPDWWEGHRYDKSVRCWAAGKTNTTTRDKVQAILLGDGTRFGTGFIPKKLIHGKPVAARNIGGLVDFFEVTHVSGGISRCKIKSYEQHPDTFESDSIDWLWLDEEPPPDHFGACLARTTATRGRYIITFTPLEGPTEVVSHFWPRSDTPTRAFLMMEVGDCVVSKGGHIPDEDVAEIISKYPAHEREARSKGIPSLGSGKIYKHTEDAISCEPIEIPDGWPRLVGLDLGGAESATAMAWCAWDKDSDSFYVYDVYKATRPEIPMHAAAMKAKGPWIPCAWPHDANIHDRGSGERYAEIYRNSGCNMLHEHATHDDVTKGLWVEPGVTEIDEWMGTGRFKVFRHLLDWFEEYRVYHRKKGQIVKQNDHLMDATRYAFMMRRHARLRPSAHMGQNQMVVSYDPLRPPMGAVYN